jgi:hypothetical protein
MDLLRAAVAVALLASCFEPEELDGALHCSAVGECPEGFRCGGDQLCWQSVPPLPECSNGTDDDCDGVADDFDPGCSGPADPSELGTKKCDNGLDDDGDGLIDFHIPACGPASDPQCDKADDDSEM